MRLFSPFFLSCDVLHGSKRARLVELTAVDDEQLFRSPLWAFHPCLFTLEPLLISRSASMLNMSDSDLYTYMLFLKRRGELLTILLIS
jgi:hypothetical protein